MPSSQLPKHTHSRVSANYRNADVGTSVMTEMNSDLTEGVYSNLLPAKTMIGLHNDQTGQSLIKFESIQTDTALTEDQRYNGSSRNSFLAVRNSMDIKQKVKNLSSLSVLTQKNKVSKRNTKLDQSLPLVNHHTNPRLLTGN